MSLPKVFIHIGRPKTGTTSIQNFFSDNRKLLIDQGVLYAKCGVLGGAHDILAVSLLKKVPLVISHLPRKDIETLHEAYKAELKKYKPEIVVISSELFTLMTPPSKELTRLQLKEFFGGSSVSIITYFRNQPEYLESSYSQEIRNSRMSKPVVFNEFIKVFSERKSNDYFWSCHQWAKVFGKDNIIVRPFQRAQLRNNDVVSDIVKVIGLSEDRRWLRREKISNPSLSPQRIELINRLADLPINGLKSRKLYIGIQQCCKVDVERPTQTVLSYEEMAEINKIFFESNNKVARNYLGCNDGRMFWGESPEKIKQYFSGVDSVFLKEFSIEIRKTVPAIVNDLLNVINTYGKNDRVLSEWTIYLNKVPWGLAMFFNVKELSREFFLQLKKIKGVID